ncbi:heavy metal translocating P-type ATPase [Devosia sp. BSSL-BM10]|uniref:P-type Zn(2+) transporter n=1 Tax=Devosia litorisediminis TaxID=2829817 RepID=A0A942E5B7_9HYPH|nr:heavy metal translocating P-type ATPase [Devosia litorisediminis]MBS3847736.1 heavy metal translocating P-type ATPase [Devosia litorisediminis]
MLAIALTGLSIGTALWFTGFGTNADLAWTLGTTPVLAGLLWQIIITLRRGDVGLDVVAALSMSAALAFGEPLAGNVVALMYSGGQLLETFAAGRARQEMTALLGRVARTAMRYDGTRLHEIDITAISPGDRLLIRHGEVLPVDGHVAAEQAELDMSALTGESIPVHLADGAEALSGSTLIGAPFDLVASRPAAESTYAGIVRLVEAAQSSKAPMARMADRYAMGFLLLTVILAGAAWAFSGDHLRALAVLVVATPCPLILAVPVAIISGMSRTARIGVLVKNGGMLEALADVRTAVLDKTGTLTGGQAEVTEIRPMPGITQDDVLRRAASLDQASGHVVAAALLQAAAARKLTLSPPTNVVETAGEGLHGQIDDRTTAVGSRSYVIAQLTGGSFDPLTTDLPVDAMTVAIAVDGRPFGLIVLQDRIRPDARQSLDALRAAGLTRIILASGDRDDIAQAVGTDLGVDFSVGGLHPEDKVAILRREKANNAKVMMVGDGINDAPALALADVGVAMGARGAAASSEAAGIVLLVDALAPLAKAVTIAKRTRRIALESVVVGLGLSLAAMIAAALGYLPPVQGALLQEVIDVAVILNALRALR